MKKIIFHIVLCSATVYVLYQSSKAGSFAGVFASLAFQGFLAWKVGKGRVLEHGCESQK